MNAQAKTKYPLIIELSDSEDDCLPTSHSHESDSEECDDGLEEVVAGWQVKKEKKLLEPSPPASPPLLIDLEQWSDNVSDTSLASIVSREPVKSEGRILSVPNPPPTSKFAMNPFGIFACTSSDDEAPGTSNPTKKKVTPPLSNRQRQLAKDKKQGPPSDPKASSPLGPSLKVDGMKKLSYVSAYHAMVRFQRIMSTEIQLRAKIVMSVPQLPPNVLKAICDLNNARIHVDKEVEKLVGDINAIKADRAKSNVTTKRKGDDE